MRVHIHGNCQALALSRMLAEALPAWTITAYQVFQETIVSEIELYYDCVRNADVILTQPVQDGYRGRNDLGSSFIRAYARPGATIVTFPSLHFEGQLPGIRSPSYNGLGLDYQDVAFLACYARSFDMTKVIPAILSAEFYGEERVEQEMRLALDETRRREKADAIDLPVSVFLERHGFERQLFHVINHPYRSVLASVANAFLQLIDIPAEIGEAGPDYLEFPHFPACASVRRMFKRNGCKPGAENEALDAVFKAPRWRMSREEFYSAVAQDLLQHKTSDIADSLAASYPSRRFLSRAVDFVSLAETLHPAGRPPLTRATPSRPAWSEAKIAEMRRRRADPARDPRELEILDVLLATLRGEAHLACDALRYAFTQAAADIPKDNWIFENILAASVICEAFDVTTDVLNTRFNKTWCGGAGILLNRDAPEAVVLRLTIEANCLCRFDFSESLFNTFEVWDSLLIWIRSIPSYYDSVTQSAAASGSFDVKLNDVGTPFRLAYATDVSASFTGADECAPQAKASPADGQGPPGSDTTIGAISSAPSDGGVLANLGPAAAGRVAQIAAGLLGVPVTLPAYGAIDDCLGDTMFVTWALNDATVSLHSCVTPVTVTNTGPGGVAHVAFPTAAAGLNNAPQPAWVGRPIAISGGGSAGGALVARVAGFFLDTANGGAATLVLNIAAPTPITASSQQVACPCFTTGLDGSGMPSVVGKAFFGGRLGSAGGAAAANEPVVGKIFLIASVANPFAVTLAPYVGLIGTYSALPESAGTAQPMRVEWGTDNTAAVLNAGNAALRGGLDSLIFLGRASVESTGRFGLFGWGYNNGPGGPDRNYDAALNLQFNTVASCLNWRSVNAATFITSARPSNDVAFNDVESIKGAIPLLAPSAPPPKKGVSGSASLPRCSTTDTVVVLVIGDSWANADPSGQGNGVWGPFAQNFCSQNPGKTIHFVSGATLGINGLTWHSLSSTIGRMGCTFDVDGLGSITPDLVCLFVTGGNDAGALLPNDLFSVVNTVRGWPRKNGLPPDILLLTGAYPRTTQLPGSGFDYQQTQPEFGSVFHRSVARTKGYGIIDIARHAAYALRGWCEDALPMKYVACPPAATVTAISPLLIPYLCRDFFAVVVLGTPAQDGATVWSGGNIRVGLSVKPDNVLNLSADDSGYLNVSAITWGKVVSTPLTLEARGTELTTSGQSSIETAGYSYLTISPPSYYAYFGGGAGVPAGSTGLCFLAGGTSNNSSDYRSWIVSQNGNGFLTFCDANYQPSHKAPACLYVGGQMFTAQDATAEADVIVQGAGSTAHPLTGANSLATTVAGYSTAFSITLAAPNANAALSGSYNVFVGRISVKPTYSQAVRVGADAGAQPALVIRKSGTRVKVSYVLGGRGWADPRTVVQRHGLPVWEGEAELFGGPFAPKIFADSPTAMQVVQLMIDDRSADLRQPVMTMQQAFGMISPDYGYAHGGDGGHPSQVFLNTIVKEVTVSEDLTTGNSYSCTYGSTTAVASTVIPNNQATTVFNSAGAAFTITLPAVFPQGGLCTIVNEGSPITAATILGGANTFGGLVGPSSIPAKSVIAYRLLGTVWTRVH